MKVSFGEWTFDADTRQLRHGTEDVHISTKAFELLKLLLEARPRVLTKSELQEALWPGVFVSEASLFTLIAEIRRAIDDEAKEARLIRTVHGVGYAFSGAAADLTSGAGKVPAVGVLIWEKREFRLPEGEHVIGRDLDVSVTLDSSMVSRHHARLCVTRTAASIQDLDSKNGTFVNDARVIGEVSVVDGDRIRLGSLLTTFRRIGATYSTKTEQLESDK